MRRPFHFWETFNRLTVGFLLFLGLNAAAQTSDFPEPLTRQPPDSAYRAIRTSLQRAVQTRNTVAESDALQELGLLFFFPEQLRPRHWFPASGSEAVSRRQRTRPPGPYPQ